LSNIPREHGSAGSRGITVIEKDDAIRLKLNLSIKIMNKIIIKHNNIIEIIKKEKEKKGSGTNTKV